MPGGAALARAYGIAGFCRPGKTKPPPGDMAAVRLMPGGAALARAYGIAGFCRPGKAKPPPGEVYFFFCISSSCSGVTAG